MPKRDPKSAKGGPGAEPEVHNRKARHLYHVLDTLECGVKLYGSEVKSVRAGRISIAEGYVVARESPLRLELHGVHIDEYAPATGARQHKPTQTRSLLAHKREIVKLARKAAEKGVTIVPLKVYFKEGRVKVLVGVARGKREYDKRQDIKKRETDRDLRRTLVAAALTPARPPAPGHPEFSAAPTSGPAPACARSPPRRGSAPGAP